VRRRPRVYKRRATAAPSRVPTPSRFRDAFELTSQLRLDHQVAQLIAGLEPNDEIELAELSPLQRNYLKETFRAVISVQRRVLNDLSWNPDVRRPSLLRTPTSPAAKLYAGTPVEAVKTPWRKAHYCVVDLELSGLDPRNDEIISFAAVPIDAGRVLAGSTLYGLCRPTRPLPERSILIHGIRTVDLAEAPPLDEAIRPLITAMAGRVLVVHVAWVERSFLGRAFARQGLRLREPVLDTCELGQLLALTRQQPPAPRALDELARSLNLPFTSNITRWAMRSRRLSCFWRSPPISKIHPETVQSLARASQRLSSYRG